MVAIASVNMIRHISEKEYRVLLLFCCLIYLLPVFLNYFMYYRASRVLTSTFPTVSLVALSVSHKLLYPHNIKVFNYFDVRFFLIACMAVPLMVIPDKEKKLLFFTLLLNFICLALLDPIYNAVGVGYDALVGGSPEYYMSANFFSLSAYVFILLAVFSEKKISDTALGNNDTLIAFLNKANTHLEKQKQEIAEQNSEIKIQTEELLAKQEQLVVANQIIEKQKEALLEIQSGLRSELTERHKELTQSNEQLIKTNIELQQFSYSISHNLRGPLARLLGLTNLMEKDLSHLTGTQLELVKLVKQSSQELDDVIRDLGKIIDIRTDLHRIREKVFFQTEWALVMRSLTSFTTPDMRIECDFKSAPIVYTVRPILTSILYNLCSNAIKYRSPLRPLHLTVKTYLENNTIILKVSDNGLGMDLAQFNRNIFGLYKRYHTHTEGKGLGLYLVKLQTEMMGGKVEVVSQLHTGTTFTVTFSEPEQIEIEEQVFFEDAFGTLFYNARLNAVGISWKRQPTSEEYRQLFIKAQDMIRLYKTSSWLSDISNQGYVSPENQQWVLTNVLPDAVKNGLLRIANVYGSHPSNQDYLIRIKQAVEANQITCSFFSNAEDAVEWLEKYNVSDTYE